ncbi:hypothetical protein COU74_05025 [Candidatus Peregrinibacteria bacterium CG10_big_fil_rev_8_21_14_0_10_36_19]|nr:MAG: hypothetical protein COU74_05025 [Candidatus Peregrinibacteria bacterium CG10_big_fil_rev_8_21_14_0_10_36_19]
MNRLKTAVLGLALGTAGAGVGYIATPKSQQEKPPIVDTNEAVDGSPDGINNPKIKESMMILADVLVKNGIDPQEVHEALNNPNDPLPEKWITIIMEFLVLGVGLSIDVGILTVLMETLKTSREKIQWALAVPAMHFIFPEITGRGASGVLANSALSFAAVACFALLIKEMHGEEAEESEEDGSPENNAMQKVQLAVKALIGGAAFKAGSVSMDALAAGPMVAERASDLGISMETANGISTGAVLACTLIAIGLQKYKDSILRHFDEDHVEMYGKALATGAFSWFLFKAFSDGIAMHMEHGLTPEQVNAAVAGFASIAPVLSVMHSTSSEASAATELEQA